MDNKQKKILQAVIFEYIETTRPISSKQLVSKCGYSASSIRNHMAYLEKNGYLKSPHTSSGKVPSDKGWRYLISELLEINLAILDKKEELGKNYTEQIKKENLALAELSKTFFYILEHSGYNLSPKPEKTFFREILFRAVDRKTFRGIIFSSSGAVKSFTVKTEEPVRQEFLDGVSELMNKILSGVALSKIKNNFGEITELDRSEYQKKLDFIKNNFEIFFNFESVEDNIASKIAGEIKKDIYERENK
ncbi:MAG: hypothetical protein Q7K21_03745 [Elusimicrobiota bacterium]|nr:hypothetical protein [Elusimicrobiota bacterium]